MVDGPEPGARRDERRLMGSRTLLIMLVAGLAGTLVGIGVAATAWLGLPTAVGFPSKTALSVITGLGTAFVTFWKVAKDLHELVD